MSSGNSGALLLSSVCTVFLPLLALVYQEAVLPAIFGWQEFNLIFACSGMPTGSLLQISGTEPGLGLAQEVEQVDL